MPSRPTFANALSAFLSDNRAAFLEHQCYAIEFVANTMLAKRTPEEIAHLEAVLSAKRTPPLDLTSEVFAAVTKNRKSATKKTVSGEQYEYYAAAASAVMRDIRLSIERPPDASNTSSLDEYQRWAEYQAGQLIEKALEEYVEFLFPGRQTELFSLLEIAFFVVARKCLGEFQTSVLPTMPTIIEQILNTPGIFDVLKSGIAEIEWRTKADAAGKAGRLGHKRTKPAKDFAIAQFRAKTWPSARQAAIKIYPMVVEKFGDILQSERAEITLQEWFLKDLKERKAEK